MQQQDQQGAGPAQPSMFGYDDLLGKHGKPAAQYVAACDSRCVFESEAELEYTIMHDPQALQVLADTLGININSVVNQVRTCAGLEQRADLVMTGGRWKRPLSVLELMLHELDSDHIRRGMFYAMSLRTPHLVLIAPSFPPRAHSLIKVIREWLAEVGNPITVHLVALRTERCAETGDGYYHLTPVMSSRPTPRRAQAFLEALAQAAAWLGDESLMDLALTDNRRMESYQGLGERTRIRIGAVADALGYSHMSISRAFRELEAAGLAGRRGKGRLRPLHLAHPKAEAWRRAQGLLTSPVSKRYLADTSQDLGAFTAGASALALTSRLAAPRTPTLAISADRWRRVRDRLPTRPARSTPFLEEDQGMIEVWKYPPEALAKQGVVDPLSLYLSLRDDPDERVQQALAETLEALPW